MSINRLSTICVVVERSGYHCGVDLVSLCQSAEEKDKVHQPRDARARFNQTWNIVFVCFSQRSLRSCSGWRPLAETDVDLLRHCFWKSLTQTYYLLILKSALLWQTYFSLFKFFWYKFFAVVLLYRPILYTLFSCTVVLFTDLTHRLSISQPYLCQMNCYK